MLNKQLILDTAELIDPYIVHPPLDRSIYLSNTQHNVYLKNDGLQYTKSFKLRGALSKLLRLTDEEKARGVVAVSSGNHGIAVSYACQLLGIDKALIFVPENTPTAKTEKIEYFGAELIIKGKSYDEAHNIGMSYVHEHDMVYIDAYDNDEIIYAGQGTAGLEILTQNPDIDTILVPIGGGGLITGIATIAKALKPDIKIIGVQTEACPAMKASMDDHVLYAKYDSKESICEALIGGVGKLAYALSSELIDDVILVSEAYIRVATKHMIIKEKIVSEPSSCVPIAALLQHKHYPFGKNIAVLLSGSNIDGQLMLDILNEKEPRV